MSELKGIPEGFTEEWLPCPIAEITNAKLFRLTKGDFVYERLIEDDVADDEVGRLIPAIMEFYYRDAEWAYERSKGSKDVK